MTREDVLTIYDGLIAGHSDLRRKGKANAYTALNGNMFSFVGPDAELCIRLSKEDIARYGINFDASPVIRYGSVMNGYVAVSEALLRDPDELSLWFDRSVEFARALPVKATTKKK